MRAQIFGEGALRHHAVIYEPDAAIRARLASLLNELHWTCLFVESLEELPRQIDGAWAVVASVTGSNRKYFERLVEGLGTSGFCALVEPETFATSDRDGIFSRWRVVEKPFADEHFLDQLVGALLDRS